MELRTRHVNDVVVLELDGRFDAHTSSPVDKFFEEATLQKPANLVVNLEGVHFVDSTALSALVSGMKRARQLDGDLRLCHLQQPVRMIFELTRLDRAFEIFTGEEEAVQAFGTQDAFTNKI
ncbi:MAG: STAS domain-containing protein [Chloroflexi bacterium]|nr:STAS domain-containing protein [Chloroflexota bacterium]